MREMMLGLVGVGVLAGIMLGRNAERFRRSRVDLVAAKVALKKGRGTNLAQMRSTAVTVFIVAAVLVAVFVAATSLPG